MMKGRREKTVGPPGDTLWERLRNGWDRGWRPTMITGSLDREHGHPSIHAMVIISELVVSELERAGLAEVRLAPPRLERKVLYFEDLPDEFSGLRLAHLSDLHLGFAIKPSDVEDLARRVMAEEPDLVTVTGDFINRSVDELAGSEEALRLLRAPLGLYGVPGNHDQSYGRLPVIETLSEIGVEMLVNRSVLLERGGARLRLAGVDDLADGSADPAAALAGARGDDFRLLLSHSPNIVLDLDGAPRPHLVLSGHTHGGQLILPGPLKYLSVRKSRYLAGLYRKGPTLLHVSRGVGVVGVPWRIGSPAEVHILELRRGRPEKRPGRFRRFRPL